MIVVVLKRCARCREDKPTSVFNLDCRSRDGFSAYCKACKLRQVEDRRTRLRATNAWKGAAEKQCAECQRVLPAERFYLAKGELDGLSYQCRACFRRYARNRLDRIKAFGPIPVSRKQCRTCGDVLPRESFSKQCSSVDGLSSNCRGCSAIAAAVVQYAIPFEHAALLKQQTSCDICQDQLTDKNRNIDHSHSTGHVRGVLCRGCNFMLGMAKDRPEVLEKGADYLRRNGAIKKHCNARAI